LRAARQLGKKVPNAETIGAMKADWKHQIEGDLLSQAVQGSLGSTFSIFKPSEDARPNSGSL
jgi:hypothetical protein